MQTDLMVRPSSFVASGLTLKEFGNIHLFKFNDDLHERKSNLLEKKKASLLTTEEEAEYAGILDLERIFTLINAQLATKAKWCAIVS